MTAPAATAPTVRYRAARVWDGRASSALRDGYVDVEAGRITAIGTDPSAPVPPGADVVDLGDATVLPGLINAHVHATWDCTPDVIATLTAEAADGGAALLARGRRNLRAAAASGVTTVRDLGTPTDVALALRAGSDTASGGAQLITSGAPITSPGGHCHFVSHQLGPDDDPAALTDRCADDDVDVIKVFASGGNLTPGSSPLSRQLEVDTLRRIVGAAARRGLRVAGHAHSVSSIADCIEAGVATIEHCTFATAGEPQLDADLVRRLVETRTFALAVPGMDSGYAWLASLDPAEVPPTHRDKVAHLQRGLPLQREATRRMLDAGVAFACGTDAGIPMSRFGDLPATIAWYGSPDGLQMSPAEALRTATSLAAEACGLSDRGILEAGARADLLVVDGDPMTSLADLCRTRMVLIGGREVVGSRVASTSP